MRLMFLFFALFPVFFHTADCYGFCPKLLRLHCLCILSIHISSASSSVSWRLLPPSSSSQKRLLCFRRAYSQMLQKGLWTARENYKPQNAQAKIPLTTSHMNYNSATLDHISSFQDVYRFHCFYCTSIVMF